MILVTVDQEGGGLVERPNPVSAYLERPPWLSSLSLWEFTSTVERTRARRPRAVQAQQEQADQDEAMDESGVPL